MQRRYKIKKRVLSIGFVAILWTAFVPPVSAQNNDFKLLHSITASRNPGMEPFHKGLSFSVYPALLLSPSIFAVTGFIKKDTLLMQTGLCIASGIALNTALTYGLKYTINRQRPYLTYAQIVALETESSSSMPSGHTSSAFNVATSLTLFYPKWYVAVPAYTWASGVAYSRMYLGVHYPSDLIAGAILGSGTAWLTYYLNKKWFGKAKSK